MLGEMIGEFKGKITGYRVLPSEGMYPKVETSVQMSGKLLGVDATNLVTYLSVMRPGGELYGEGQGVIMTKDGENLTWIGHGVGRFTGRGSAVSFRGDNYLQTASAKLARLNSVAVVFEYEADENGNTHVRIWEWK